VTLATPAFKPLLYNWLCFLRYKAKWGNTPSTSLWDDNDDARPPKLQVHEDVPKVLIVTSDEAFARELSEAGFVVWWLTTVNWAKEEERAEASGEGEENELPEEDVKRIERMLQDDLFVNLRLLDLLLPPNEDGKLSSMLPWGTLHYQSLMLERTLVMSALVGTLVESQRVETEDRKREEKDWWDRVMAHDWEESRLEQDEFVGVKGVLLVDNDAVWCVKFMCTRAELTLA
jgi:hypothetical protein